MIIRIQAFLVHLSVSLVLALAAVALVFYVWYPSPLSEAVGVAGVFFLILGVDVVLGPLLTFIVFNPAKKSLPYDLAIIAVLQLVAFGYGMLAVAEGRPAWLVFNADRFDLVQAVDIDKRRLAEAKTEYQYVSWTGPRWVAAIPPQSVEERNQILFEAVTARVDLPQRPNLYVPLWDQMTAMQKGALPLHELGHYNTASEIEAVLKEWPRADAWLPLMSRVKPLVVLIKKNTADVVAVVDLKPWY